jgi:hypothetical protein
VYALFLGQIAEGLTGAFGGVLMTIFGMVADITIPGKTRALPTLHDFSVLDSIFDVSGINNTQNIILSIVKIRENNIGKTNPEYLTQ